MLSSPLSIRLKMAELPDMDSRLIGVLRRLGIEFGFGEKSVEEVCEEHGVNPFALLLIAKVYIHDKYSPTKEDLAKSGIRDIVKYLHSSHNFYVGIATETLAAQIRAVAAECDKKTGSILLRFFDEYKGELLKHFEYEEKTVFPYVLSLDEGRPITERYSIQQYEENHSNVDEKLNDLKSIIMKYIPKGCSSNLIQGALGSIYTLKDDLAKHTAIEDNILVPMVNSEEMRLGKAHKARPESRYWEDGKDDRREELSEREKEILVCVAKGMLNKEIADKLFISTYTVITHRKNITRKTGIKTVAGLTVYALLNGLIDIGNIE